MKKENEKELLEGVEVPKSAANLLKKSWINELFSAKSDRIMMSFLILSQTVWKKKELAEKTGLSRSSVYRTVDRLAKLDLVKVRGEDLIWNRGDEMAIAIEKVIDLAQRRYLAAR